ncbi:MAG: TlpA family protein disulfide reductase [Chromatiales bacterium]|nr:TlpA family protein disulfide reductase [Chromatiales bacterium]
MKQAIAAVFAVIGLIAGISTYLYNAAKTGAESAPQVPSVAATQAPAKPAPSLNTVRSVQTRPEFSLADTAGVMRSITEWDGKAMVVNFWATWCAPCRREMPLLKELQIEYAGDDVQIIGIAVDLREDVLGYLEQMPVNYPVMIGDQDAIDAAEGFGVEFMAMPFTAFTDHQGNVLHVQIGEVHRPQAELIFNTVARVRTGEIDPAMARRVIAHGMAGVQDTGT